MPNSFYNHGGYPATGSVGTSEGLRFELSAIALGLDKLPTLGSANAIITQNANGTRLVSSLTTLSASGALTVVSIAGDGAGLTGLNASAITTGLLSISQGGTGGSNTPTAGAVAYGTGTAYAFTSVGAPGQVLTSTGAGAPVWGTAAAAGGASATVSNINTAETHYPLFTTQTSGDLVQANVDATTTPLSYTPSTGVFTATTFSGGGSGLTGTASGLSIGGNAGTATTLQTARTINGTSFNGSANITVTANTTNSLSLGVSGTGLSGSATFNGGAATTFTVTSNATNANTASTIVARDASGNFSAGTITAALSGNATTATSQSGGTVNATTGAFSGNLSVTGLATLNGGLSTSTINAATTLNLQTGGTTKATITNAGNLLVGTTTDNGKKIDVRGLNTQTIRAVSENGGIAEFDASSLGGFSWKFQGTSDSMRFVQDATERARITSAGYFKAAPDASYTNAVHHEFVSTGGNCLVSTGKVASGGNTIYASVIATGASYGSHYQALNNATLVYQVAANGQISSTSTTITSISDQRMKENIRPLSDGLAAINTLQPRMFDWKEGKGRNVKNDRGFIAQEFETVFPDMIEEWKDGDETYKALRADLIPVLVKAVQELSAQNAALESRLAALEAK